MLELFTPTIKIKSVLESYHMSEIPVIITKKVYHPENAGGLKVHIYKEGQAINPRMWSKLVVPGDCLKALKDETGKMWLALNARAHFDVTNGLRQEGIDIVDSEETRFQIQVDSKGKVVKIFVPFSITWDSERGARKVLHMIPQQAQAENIILSGSGASKVVGSDIITYYDQFGLNIDENDPRVVEIIELRNGSKYYNIRVDLPEDLR